MSEEKQRKTPSAKFLAGIILVAALHALPFVTRPALVGGDEPHYALMAHSIAVDRDLDLDRDYAAVESGSPAAGARRAGKHLEPHVIDVRGRRVFSHPLGLPAFVAPLIAIESWIKPDAPPDWLLGIATLTITFAALIACWRLTYRVTNNARLSALVFGLYFSTPLWYYSRTFFTEPYVWSFAVLGTALVVRDRPVWGGVFFALALGVKETALLIVGPILVSVALLYGWRRMVAVAIGPVMFAALFVAKNLALTGSPFMTFQPYRIGRPLLGTLGLLGDVSHGLLWFGPLAVVAGLGWFLPSTGRNQRIVTWTLVSIAASYCMLAAFWVDWRGGSCYGPRLIVPILIATAHPLVKLYAFAGPITRGLLETLFVCGFSVNFTAACDPFFAFWGPSVFDLLAKNLPVALAGAIIGVAFVWWFRRLGVEAILIEANAGLTA